MRYRRNFIPGGSYFFTLTTAHRQAVFQKADNVRLLGNAFRHVREKYPFSTDGIVVLPDHIHAIWTLPSDDSDYPIRWRLIKTWFSKHSVHIATSQRPIWQARYWEHTIKNTEDFNRHMDYIHWNPVKHGYVEHVRDWPWSSFSRLVMQGRYPHHWGTNGVVLEHSAGEP